MLNIKLLKSVISWKNCWSFINFLSIHRVKWGIWKDWQGTGCWNEMKIPTLIFISPVIKVLIIYASYDKVLWNDYSTLNNKSIRNNPFRNVIN